MKLLPEDIIYYITDFLNLNDLCTLEQADKDFHLPKQKRKKRFNWCAQRITKRQKYSDGKCSDNMCGRQTAMCIQLEPLKRIVLSNYCSIHTKIHTNQKFFNI